MIRYPRGTTHFDINQLPSFNQINGQTWYDLQQGKNGFLIGYGENLNLLLEANDALGLDYTITNARFIKPIDSHYLDQIIKTNRPVFIYEDVESSGSLYAQVLRYLIENNYKGKIGSLTYTNKIISHGSISDNKKDAGVSYSDLIHRLKAFKNET